VTNEAVIDKILDAARRAVVAPRVYGEIRVCVDDDLIAALIDATAALDGMARVEIEALLLQCRLLARAQA
jgi:hypothetical protein